MKISTGSQQGQRHHREDQVDAAGPDALVGRAGVQALGSARRSPAAWSAIVVTAMASGARASWAAVCPMTMYSESGDGSAASPIVPASRPG